MTPPKLDMDKIEAKLPEQKDKPKIKVETPALDTMKSPTEIKSRLTSDDEEESKISYIGDH